MKDGPTCDGLHRFCWADLATSDDAGAAGFYAELFGWAHHGRVVRGGRFRTLGQRGEVFASVYQLSAESLGRGVPPHWTPYVSTTDLDRTLARAVAIAARVVVPPVDFPGLARVALIADPYAALIGLWQQEPPVRAAAGDAR
jgi:predicted enzyme related to lactoylglutathione lyase